MEGVQTGEYKLSASLVGHEDDVRAVAYPSPKAVITASRDGTVRTWKLLSDNPPLFDASISSNATSFVNTVAYLPPSAEYPEGLVVSGGKDTIVDVRPPSKAPQDNAEAMLLGHSNNVCSLDVDPAGKFIVSGAWDGEARIWPVGKWESQAVLGGHQGAVWDVLAYDSETIITACADKQIRIFHFSGKLLKTIKGSDAPQRALCRLPQGHPSGADFASACNEGVIRLWTLSGREVAQLLGHEAFIYCLASSPSGEIISSGEDRTLRIWKGTECIQTITHPAISVWAVAVCPETGDIVSGASDRVARVFTRDTSRAADTETTKAFEDSVKESSIPQQALPQINKEKLPGPEFLTQKSGTKEGQVQMIKELNGAINAYQWSVGQQQWNNIGSVVDAVGSSGKKTNYLGKEYDYVFDVDIEDGKPALKLPYNLSQNPYEAATKFINDNELPISYLDEVANFITKNTAGSTIGQSQETSVPDPWGSDSRYRPGDAAAPAPTQTPAAPKAIPQTAYLNIVNAQVSMIQKKIGELNQALISGGNKDVSLNPSELNLLASLCKHLQTSGATKASSSIEGGLDLAVKIITTWPYKDRLAGLDLIRLLAVAPQTATYTHSNANIIDILAASATESQPPTENYLMMAVRAFANLFDSNEGRALAVEQFEKVQEFVTSATSQSTNRNLLVAVATLYINYAVYFKTAADSPSFDHVLALLNSLGGILTTQSDPEVVYRAMVATGTLLTLDEETRSAAKDVYGIEKSLATATAKAPESEKRIRVVSGEIAALLRQ